MSDLHELFLGRWGRAASSRFIYFEKFEPLGVAEFRSLSTNDRIQSLPDDKLERLWIKPVQRMLQQRFRIEQRGFTNGTNPSLDELKEDFKIAAAITIDKFYANQDEKIGDETIDGVGTSKWDTEVPARAKALLERYKWTGGKIGRA